MHLHSARDTPGTRHSDTVTQETQLNSLCRTHNDSENKQELVVCARESVAAALLLLVWQLAQQSGGTPNLVTHHTQGGELVLATLNVGRRHVA